LNQRNSVLEYQTEFEKLLNKVTGVSEAALISIYTAGLKTPIHREVLLRRPSTLTQTFALARELAANHSDTVSAITYSTRRFGQSVASGLGNVSVPVINTDKGVTLPSTVLPSRQVHSVQQSSLPIRHLSPAERSAHIQRSLLELRGKVRTRAPLQASLFGVARHRR